MSEDEQAVAQLDVSVVIPVHNAEATLPACLRSLRAQTLPADRYEVIVVDNNSTDGSAALARLAPGVKLYEEPRQGAYAARNRGLLVARGHIVTFTDPDCIPAPDWLETAVAALSDGTVVAVGETLPSGGSRALELLSTYGRVKDEYIFGGSDIALYYGRTNNMAVLRSVFEELGLFVEEPRGADTMLVRNVVERYGAESVRFVPSMRVRHAELDGLGPHLRKMHVYGYARRAYWDATPGRTLRAVESLRLLRRAVRRIDGPAALPALVVLAAAAQASWRLGVWRAAANIRPPRGVTPARTQRST